MDAAEFLSLVLARTGFPCIVTPAPYKGKGFWHHPASSIEAAVKIALHQHTMQRDVFFAVGTLKEPDVVDPDTGKKSYRTAANINCWKCWIADLDIGTNSPKKYPSQAEAITHLSRFCKDTGLPIPMLVSSGYGVHAYWICDAAIPADVWQKVAIRFKALLAAYGVLADSSRTSDVASILRVVGTSNFKDPANPKPVKLLRRQTHLTTAKTFLEQVLQASKTLNVVPPLALQWTPTDNNSGLGSFDIESPPSELSPIITKCNQIRTFVLAKGDVPETHWYRALQLVKFCKHGNTEGEELAQKLSTGYPGYSHAETAERLRRLATRKPTLCKTFEDANSEGCADCPHRGHIRSPIVFGMVTAEAEAPTMTIQHRDGNIEEVEIPKPPLPWVRTAEKKLGRKTKDPQTGHEYIEIFYDYDIYPTKRMIDESTGTELYYFRSYLPKDGWREYPISPSMVYDSRSLFQTMAERGVMPSVKNKEILAAYMLSYMKELQVLKQAESIYSQMGWKKDNSEFISGDTSYKSDGTNIRIKVAEGYTSLLDNFESKGDLKTWVSITDLYNTPHHEDFGLALMAGFGAPMFCHTGFEGGVFSLNGASGAGKSTILSVIHSIYGKPKCNVLLRKDTGNSKAAVLSAYNNLPVTLDEITTIGGEEASQLVFDVTDGRDKQRLNSDASLKASIRTWGLILFTTTNRSLPQLVLAFKPEASGEMMRILERRVDALDQQEYAQARKKFEPLNDNYGIAGPILLSWYASNLPEAIRLLNGFTDRLSDAVGGLVPERFWLSMCGTALLGCYVGKLLGLHNFEVETVFTHCCRVVLESRIATAGHTKRSIDVLVDFVNHSLGGMLIVHESAKAGQVEVRSGPKFGELIIRNELVSKRMFIDYSALLSYCNKRGHDFNNMQKELIQSKVVLRPDAEKGLGDGTDFAGGKTKVWVVDTESPLMSGVIPLLATTNTTSDHSPARLAKS